MPQHEHYAMLGHRQELFPTTTTKRDNCFRLRQVILSVLGAWVWLLIITISVVAVSIIISESCSSDKVHVSIEKT